MMTAALASGPTRDGERGPVSGPRSPAHKEAFPARLQEPSACCAAP